MRSILTLIIVGVAVSTSAVRAQEPRPFIYGCGITWGEWLGLPMAQARQFDRNTMDMIVQMGGTNCPANFAWIGIEPVQGVFNWDYVDHQVDEALARGLEIFAYTGLTPDWALPPGILEQYGSGIGYRFPPDEQYIPQFENFFRTLAARYRGRVKYYEFWNEPNGCSWINDNCSNGHMAHTYVPWLKRWYTAMKEGDPDCVLAVGGLDYNQFVTNGYRYIEDIYAHGGGDYFDAVAIHPYGNPLHWDAITQTYNVLVQHGHGHKKLWLNEYGWDTGNEQVKAANLTTVLETLKQPEYHMVFMANYLVLTDLPGTPDHGHDYGLCSRNTTTLTITPRQSWYAFQALDKSWPLAAEFTANPQSGAAPLTVQFTDRSYYPGATARLWEFGDGQTSSQVNPVHTYQNAGSYTVRLTVSGPAGPRVAEKPAFIQVGDVPVDGVENPSFEDGGGSLDGWELVVAGGGPDNPPLPNISFGVSTTAGTHWAGKITSWETFDFQIGQVIGTSQWQASSPLARWQLSALVQLHSRHNSSPIARPGNVHQVWQIGWNDDGSEPVSMMSCDHYETIAVLDGSYTDNNANFFTPLSLSGVLNVPGLRGVALRVRLYNTSALEWSFSNIDDVQFAVVSMPPVLADRDNDGDVDEGDLVAFAACRTGPAMGPPAPGCEWADFDGDQDVDHDDFGRLQRCISGPNQPASPACAQ